MRSGVRPQVADPQLGFDCNGCWSAEVEAESLREPTSVRHFIRVGCTQIQTLAISSRDGNGTLAGTANDQSRRSHPDWPKTGSRQSQTLISYALTTPQRRQHPARRVKTSHPISDPRKRNGESDVVVARQSKRAGTKADVKPTSTEGLNYSQLTGKKKHMTQADI